MDLGDSTCQMAETFFFERERERALSFPLCLCLCVCVFICLIMQDIACHQSTAHFACTDATSDATPLEGFRFFVFSSSCRGLTGLVSVCSNKGCAIDTCFL